MKWSASWLWMSIAVVGVLCIPRMSAASESTSAASGRITFTGAIVEPTCGVEVERVVTRAAASAQSMPRTETCSGTNKNVAASQIYTVSVVRLSDAEPDRVLRYFSDYVRASRVDASSPTLIIQTYE